MEAHHSKLGNSQDWELFVNERRILVRQQKSDDDNDIHINKNKWHVLSSAVLHGGLQKLGSARTHIQVLNAKVPLDYDGITPNPVDLLQRMAQEEDQDKTPTTTTTTTIGLMTAASMSTLRIATLRAFGHEQRQGKQDQCADVIVDAIVTAGISNSRTAGADADHFQFSSSHERTTRGPAGTVNTIILTNAALNESTLVEAYAVACEAKCKAFEELGIVCAKTATATAQGTGTDCTVLVAKATTDDATEKSGATPRVQYAGKHTLFGELVGQAVYQATRDAVVTNLLHTYSGAKNKWYCGMLGYSTLYRLHCYKLQLLHALKQGHRPLVPSRPMQTVPRPGGWVCYLGLMGVVLSFGVHLYCLDRSANTDNGNFESSLTYYELMKGQQWRPSGTVLMAVFAWDRFLGGSFLLPVSLHPVVLVGKLITFIVSAIPESFFGQPIFGFAIGCFLLFATLIVSLTISWFLLASALLCGNFLHDTSRVLEKLFPWFAQVYLMQSSLSLQLLCNIAIQMAHFLERGQLHRARDQLSWLCSRDPSNLRSDELAGATLESLAENLSDSLVSPLFWYVIFGPLGAFGFKVINTLDSRVGYRGRFEWVGKASARCDDMANILPARLTAVLLAIAACMILSLSGGSVMSNRKESALTTATNGIKVALRDASQCDSPNAGYPMATMAGLLNVCLEKREQYALNGEKFGGRAPGYQDIRSGIEIARLAGLLTFLLALIVSKQL